VTPSGARAIIPLERVILQLDQAGTKFWGNRRNQENMLSISPSNNNNHNWGQSDVRDKLRDKDFNCLAFKQNDHVGTVR